MEDIKKECCRCHEYKELQEFNNCKAGRLGKHNHCRKCQTEFRHEWYLKNKENEMKKGKEYSQSEACKVSRKKRYELNKEEMKLKNNVRRRTEAAKIKARIQRNKWRQIPQNKIACSLRGRIRIALKGMVKIDNTEKITGCSFELLKQYLESKFQPGMSWENYGKWHIDHILPCASFDLTIEENQRKCFHYTNLQPLWAEENISKGCSVPDKIIHNINV